jgi:hypothetical protein
MYAVDGASYARLHKFLRDLIENKDMNIAVNVYNE